MINPKSQSRTPRSNRFSNHHELPKIAMRKSYVRDFLDWREGVKSLQEVSGETNKTNEAA
jgi:hypothetical protein